MRSEKSEKRKKWYVFEIVDVDYVEWLTKHRKCTTGYFLGREGRVLTCLDCKECLFVKGLFNKR